MYYTWNWWFVLWWLVPTMFFLWMLFGVNGIRRYSRHGYYRTEHDSWDERWRTLARERRDARHRGRGPRNYRRSNERIIEDVSDRLMMDPEVDASDIDVQAHEGKVTLTGTVANRYEKRLSEWIAESVPGVSDVDNRLGIGSAPTLTSSSGPRPAYSG